VTATHHVEAYGTRTHRIVRRFFSYDHQDEITADENMINVIVKKQVEKLPHP